MTNHSDARDAAKSREHPIRGGGGDGYLDAVAAHAPVGPSDDYKALLRGEITPEEYLRRMKADVDRRLRERP